MTTCLLLIDAQESFRHRPYFSADRSAPYLAAQNALLTGCAAKGIPVVRILHADGPDEASNPFSRASGLVRPIEGLATVTAAQTFIKSRHSALVGTGLDVWLIRQGVRRIIISGIRTEQCCETTARHASDMGWEVDFVTEATLTFDMPQPDGTVLAADDVAQRTAAVLRDRFARIRTVAEVLAHD